MPKELPKRIRREQPADIQPAGNNPPDLDKIDQAYDIRIKKARLEKLEAEKQKILDSRTAKLRSIYKPTAEEASPFKRITAGRPTKYDKTTHPADVIEYGLQGMSRYEMGAMLGVTQDTLLLWCKTHSEFLEAIKLSEMYARAWWERQGRANLQNSKFNSILYMMNMQNRFGWTRKLEMDSKGAPITIGDQYIQSQNNVQVNEVVVDKSPSAREKVYSILQRAGVFKKISEENVVDIEPEENI